MSELGVLHEDERLIVVDKPTGQLVIPGRGEAAGETLREAVERHTGGKVYVVHRLDRGASGLVVFAKDAATHRALCLRFEKRDVRKRYRVLALGTLERDGRIDKPLREFGSGRIGVATDGKPASTAYRVLERLKAATLLDVEPATGRRHQIRVHLFSVGHPVLGDDRYGEKRPVGGVGRLMLHALSLELEGRPALRFKAPLPPDFEAVLQRFRA